ncbi:MAG TPA: ATP-binding protein [Burkholderiaceae bacterium]|nr:ATP-binding protein [Burkholderiaceae bacterium]
MKLDEPRHFDCTQSLADLLDARHRERISDGLNALFGTRWAIVDVNEQRLLGTIPAPPAACAPIFHQDEPVGFVIAAAAAAHVIGAARLVQAVLAANADNATAAPVVQAAATDDASLKRKYEALLQSEARLCALAQALEQRIQTQARTIEAAHRHLYRAERRVSVGQFAAGMAHEIDNPIGFVDSNLATAQRYLDELALVIAAWRAGDASGAEQLWQRVGGACLLQDLGTLLAESAASVERVTRIVADLRAFVCADNHVAARIEVNDCVRATANVAALLAAGRATIELNLAPVPTIALPPGRLNQVLLCLVQNALAAVPAGGRIWLATRAADGPAGAEVQVRVIDNGCGIEPAVVPHIFDPFFTTREAGESVGLGLTISRDIVTACGGRIDVQSVVGRGSVFTVAMPARGSA